MRSFIVRHIDSLGRIVLPKEWRDINNIDEKDSLEIHIKGNSVTIKKHEDSCVFCGNHTNLQLVNEKQVCKKCLEELTNSYKK